MSSLSFQSRSSFHPQATPSKSKNTEGTLSVVFWGYLLIALTGMFFLVTFYSLVLSKVLPTPGHPLFEWVAQDAYYTLLVPLLIPLTILTVFINWLGLKLFRHN